MIDNHPVITWTPYGRQDTVSVLLPYMRRDHERGLVDEWWLFLNTDPGKQESDLRYAYQLAREHNWIRLLERPADCPRLAPKQRNTGYAYRYMTDPTAAYVRFDDDIIYVHPDAVENLVRSKIAMTGTLACFSVIINNAIVSWHLQARRLIPGPADGWPSVQLPYCMDAIGWQDGDFAVRLHEFFLEKAETGPEAVEDLYLYQDVPLAPRQQFSVSNFALLGQDLAELDPPGVLDYPEEEHWTTVHRPQRVGKDNVIVGNAIVSHYTFYPQQQRVFATDLLDRYRRLAEKL